MDWGKRRASFDFLSLFKGEFIRFMRKQLPFMSIFNPEVKHFRFKFLKIASVKTNL
jgi:hypothetical protein